MGQMELYEWLSHQEWAKAPLDYLASTHRVIVGRFQDTFRYVSLHPDNANTFSYEFASILRDAGSAFGSFSDALVRGSDPSKSKPDIGDFLRFYSEYAPTLHKTNVRVLVLSDDFRLLPFQGWIQGGQSPGWWKAYNNVR